MNADTINFIPSRYRFWPVQYARVAQRWSTSLPRRGSRVRSPSRAWKKNDTKSVSFFFSSPARARKFDVYAPLRSAQAEVPRTSCAVSRFFIYSGSLDFTGFPLFLCGCRPAPTCTQSEHPKINLLQVAKAAYGCQGTRYGAVLSKVSWNKSKLLEKKSVHYVL